MTSPDVFDVINDLRSRDQPFCIATVVRTADLTSAKAGAKAVITQDGELLGHLGGACVRRAVLAAVKVVLDSGAARMISVRPLDADEAASMDVHPSGCPSGGTVDLFIEPWRPAPRLWIVGQTPIARALEGHCKMMGYRLGDGSMGAETIDAGDYILIASQGRDDLAALRIAVTSPAAYIAMVASRKKAASLTAQLDSEGVDPARLAQVEAPAGFDIGAIDPHEIAVACLARIIAHRRRHTAIDPASTP